MKRKLAGYVLLSFLSFGVFTGLFHTVANAQTSELIAAVIATPPLSPIATTPTQPQKILANALPTVSPTPTAEPTPTVTPMPTATPTPTPLPTATPTPKPSVIAPADLEALFSKYANEYGVNADELKGIAKCEASFNSQADNGTYAGMFQFASQTWITQRTAMGLDPNPDLRKNAEESIKTAAYMIKNGGRGAWPSC